MIIVKIVGITIANTTAIIIIFEIVLFVFLLIRLCFIVYQLLSHQFDIIIIIIYFNRKGPMVIFIVSILIINLFVFAHKSKSNKSMDQIRNDFWTKERKANLTTRKVLSDVNYIQIPINDLPFIEKANDKELEIIQSKIAKLSKEPIANFTGYTNTDLKLKYGMGNINHIIECDTNFTTFTTLMYEWGLYYHNQNKYQYAQQILEFAVKQKSDNSKIFILLAEIYIDSNQSDKIDDLIQIAESLNTLVKNKIIKSLKELKYSSYLT